MAHFKQAKDPRNSPEPKQWLRNRATVTTASNDSSDAQMGSTFDSTVMGNATMMPRTEYNELRHHQAATAAQRAMANSSNPRAQRVPPFSQAARPLDKPGDGSMMAQLAAQAAMKKATAGPARLAPVPGPGMSQQQRRDLNPQSPAVYNARTYTSSTAAPLSNPRPTTQPSQPLAAPPQVGARPPFSTRTALSGSSAQQRPSNSRAMPSVVLTGDGRSHHYLTPPAQAGRPSTASFGGSPAPQRTSLGTRLSATSGIPQERTPTGRSSPRPSASPNRHPRETSVTTSLLNTVIDAVDVTARTAVSIVVNDQRSHSQERQARRDLRESRRNLVDDIEARVFGAGGSRGSSRSDRAHSSTRGEGKEDHSSHRR